MLKNNLEIVVSSNFYRKLNDKKLKEKYNIYEFKGATYFEDSKYEDQKICKKNDSLISRSFYISLFSRNSSSLIMIK